MILALLTGLTQNQVPTRIMDPTSNVLNPGDPRLRQFDEASGTTWQVFAVNSFPEGPIVISRVEEVKQQNPPSTWGVYVGNGGLLPVSSLTMAAAVVDVNGKVKGTQVIPVIKNIKPQQLVRKEVRIRVTVFAPTDRVVFFVREMKSEIDEFKADEKQVADLIKATAAKYPVP